MQASPDQPVNALSASITLGRVQLPTPGAIGPLAAACAGDAFAHGIQFERPLWVPAFAGTTVGERTLLGARSNARHAGAGRDPDRRHGPQRLPQ